MHMVYTNYTLKPRLENNFFNPLKLYSTQKIGLNTNCAQKTLFSATARRNLNCQPLRKGAFSVNRQIKKAQTAKPPDYRIPP